MQVSAGHMSRKASQFMSGIVKPHTSASLAHDERLEVLVCKSTFKVWTHLVGSMPSFVAHSLELQRLHPKRELVSTWFASPLFMHARKGSQLGLCFLELPASPWLGKTKGQPV